MAEAPLIKTFRSGATGLIQIRGIEVKYDEVKQRLQLENFDGVKEIAVKQDFYATIFLANMAALAKMQSDEIIQEKHEEKELKHPYKTNVNIMVSVLKDELILMLR